MKYKHRHLGLLVAAVLILAGIVAVIGASPSIKWRLVGSGGGLAQGQENNLASAIGQPVSGHVSNGYTIHSGLYLEPGALGPAQQTIFLPAVLKDHCGGMSSLVEIESNDSPAEANGPLCPNVLYSGSPNSHGSDQDDDWYKFFWSGSGAITIDLDNFLTKGQLLLYFDPNGDFLDREYDQADRHYTVTYTGTGQSGVYYIRVFAPAGHDTGTGSYTLTYH